MVSRIANQNMFCTKFALINCSSFHSSMQPHSTIFNQEVATSNPRESFLMKVSSLRLGNINLKKLVWSNSKLYNKKLDVLHHKLLLFSQLHGPAFRHFQFFENFYNKRMQEVATSNPRKSYHMTIFWGINISMEVFTKT